jgi:Protein of unknown function (DUF2628)
LALEAWYQHWKNVMAIFTVHEPPLRATAALPDPERFVFVRDGVYAWAFLLTPLWMLWRGLWLVFFIYAAFAVAVENAMHYAGFGIPSIIVVQLLISLLVAVEAASLRRFTLAHRGWKNIGIVSGDDLEDAERRFYDAWVQAAPPERAEPPPLPPESPPLTPPPDIIGLFPEPGGGSR